VLSIFLYTLSLLIANLHDWADAVDRSGAYRFTRQQKLQNIQILEVIVQSAPSGAP